MLLVMSLSGCARSGLGKGCEWVEPIYFAPEDILTRQTEDAIIEHNEAYERICNSWFTDRV
jgi:hypothetical protein